MNYSVKLLLLTLLLGTASLSTLHAAAASNSSDESGNGKGEKRKAEDIDENDGKAAKRVKIDTVEDKKNEEDTKKVQLTQELKQAIIDKDEHKAAHLLVAGADANGEFGKSNSSGNTITFLHHATQTGKESIAQLLLECNANPNAICTRLTPLHDAVLYSRTNLVRRMIEHKAHVNLPMDGNETALHYAACALNQPIVQLLVAAGADRTAKNRAGRTPYQEAKRASASKEFLKLLQAPVPLFAPGALTGNHAGAGSVSTAP